MAGSARSAGDVVADLHETIQRPPFPDDREEFGGVEVNLIMAGGASVELAQLGGAGIYLRSDGRAVSVAKPMTFVHGLVAEGRLSLDEAASHPQRGILSTALFRDGSVPTGWERDRVPMKPGDQLIIVTLDLTWEIDIGAIDLAGLPTAPRELAESLLKLAPNDPFKRGSDVVVLERTCSS